MNSIRAIIKMKSKILKEVNKYQKKIKLESNKIILITTKNPLNNYIKQ